MESTLLANANPLTLMEAVEQYVKSLRSKDSNTQQHLVGFVRWMGGEDRPVGAIQPSEIGEFGEQTMGSGKQAVERLQSVRKFLSFAKRKELTDQNLAQHLRIRKGNRSTRNTTGGRPQGHRGHARRPQVARRGAGAAQVGTRAAGRRDQEGRCRQGRPGERAAGSRPRAPRAQRGEDPVHRGAPQGRSHIGRLRAERQHGSNGCKGGPEGRPGREDLHRGERHGGVAGRRQDLRCIAPGRGRSWARPPARV